MFGGEWFVVYKDLWTEINGRFGNALIIPLPLTVKNQTQIAVRVTYNTTSEARAMNWLTE